MDEDKQVSIIVVGKVIKNISPNFKTAQQKVRVSFSQQTSCLGMDVNDIWSWGKFNGVRHKAYGGVEYILAHGLREEVDNLTAMVGQWARG